ncbi:MAG: sugar phosphate isomerase/epimerase [Oscillospiraceae bacterium]|jgi:sugar phosphate isomerase/epimerase|nr:sugar phosphate isomerase/epimerase [Oscillospiraceae bacterium]
MQDSIHRYFKVGTIHFMSFPEVMRGDGDVLGTLRQLLTDDYFDAIELTWISDPAVRAQAARMLDVAGVDVCYGAQPRLLTTGLNPNALTEKDRLQAEATLREAIDEAETLGAKGIAFLAGKYEYAHREEAYSQLLKTTRALCSHAADKGMSVELEVFDFDIDRKALIGPAPLAARFAADMRQAHPNFGLIADLSHFPLTRESSRFVIQTLRPYITHLHFGSAVAASPSMTAYGDAHPRFNFPNSANGVNELRDYLRVLKEEGFFREDEPLVLSIEVKPWQDEEASLVLANTKRVLNRAWALL